MAAPTVFYRSGDIIFREGHSSDRAYVIVRGEVEIFRTRNDIEERLGLLGRGHMFGEYGVMDNAPRMASARALTETELQPLDLTGVEHDA